MFIHSFLAPFCCFKETCLGTLHNGLLDIIIGFQTLKDMSTDIVCICVCPEFYVLHMAWEEGGICRYGKSMGQNQEESELPVSLLT